MTEIKIKTLLCPVIKIQIETCRQILDFCQNFSFVPPQNTFVHFNDSPKKTLSESLWDMQKSIYKNSLRFWA